MMGLPVDLRWLFLGIGGVLVVATVIGQVLGRVVSADRSRALVANLNERILAWWPMAALAALSATAGITVTAIAFGLLSFLALREFISIVHTRRADQRSLFWAFFVLIPLQYSLVVADWYGLFLVLIPVWAFVVFAIFSTLRGDQRSFLHRVAAIQWAVMVTIYFPSHICYLLNLEIAGYDGSWGRLVLFLIVVSQCNDVLQYVCGTLFGRRRVAPRLSPGKTWGGLLGGLVGSAAIGAALQALTPFTIAEAAIMGLVIAAMGFAGDIIFSAIKRDAGIKDYGRLIAGHGGVLDRIDGLCFAAPVFFHVVHFYWG